MTHIWVPNRDVIYPKRDAIITPASMKVGGRFKIDVLNPDKTLKFSTGWFKNLITNNGLDVLGGGVGSGQWCNLTCVGSGNTAPSNSDTALVSIVASTSTVVTTTQTVQASTPYFGTTTRTWQFAQGAAAGNLSEIGVGPTATALFSRALILDSMGSPTTITVLSNEFLNVTYALEMLAPLVDTTGSVTLAGTSYNYTIRSCLVATATNNFGWYMQYPSVSNVTYLDRSLVAQSSGGIITYGTAFGTITGQPSGTVGSGFGSASDTAYSNGSYSQANSWTWGINDGNITGGIGAMKLQFGRYDVISVGSVSGGGGCFQIDWSTNKIPKDNTKQLTLNFGFAWTRM